MSRSDSRARPARILIVTHYFPPEIGAPQARLSDFARIWATDGHDVHVLTGMPNHPTGIIPSQYRGKVRVVEAVDGYAITRSWLYATPNEGIAKKTLGHISFMISSVLIGLRGTGRRDVVVVSSPTFFSIGSAWMIAKLKRARLVVEVRDLWPAVFVELGVLTNKHAIRILERLELAAYRAADAVVVVTEGFREHIVARGIPADKVHTIRNGVDLGKFTPGHQAPAGTREGLGAGPDETLVLYIGAHGISQGLTSVVDAAALLQDRPVHFALVGEGADKKAVEQHAQELGLTNVTMLPGVAREVVADLLAAADVCLVPLRDVPLFATFIPSKIFECLASGTPIIGSVEGEARTILEDAGAVVVRPENAPELAAAINSLCADPTKRTRMAANGYEYVTREFDRNRLAASYEVVFRQIRRRQ